MRWMRWGMGALGLLVATGVVAFSVISFSGAAQAEEGPNGDTARMRHQELLAQKLGISVEKLTEAQKSVRDQMIDEAVAAGKLSTEQAAKLKAGDLGDFRGALHGKVREGAKSILTNIVDAAAKVIGIDKEKVKTGLQSGQSLTQIAASNGVNRDQLKSGLATELRAEVSAALVKGTITQPQADRLLSGLDQHIDQLIDRSGDAQGPRDGMRMRPMPGGTNGAPGGMGGRFFQRGPFTQ